MDENIMELLELYSELIEKQDEIISSLARVIKKYRIKMREYQEVNGFFDLSEEECEISIDKKIAEYEKMKSQEP